MEDFMALQSNADANIGAALDQMSDLEMCLCGTDLCNTASKKAFATFLGFLFLFLLNIVI